MGSWTQIWTQIWRQARVGSGGEFRGADSQAGLFFGLCLPQTKNFVTRLELPAFGEEIDPFEAFEDVPLGLDGPGTFETGMLRHGMCVGLLLCEKTFERMTSDGDKSEGDKSEGDKSKRDQSGQGRRGRRNAGEQFPSAPTLRMLRRVPCQPPEWKRNRGRRTWVKKIVCPETQFTRSS